MNSSIRLSQSKVNNMSRKPSSKMHEAIMSRFKLQSKHHPEHYPSHVALRSTRHKRDHVVLLHRTSSPIYPANRIVSGRNNDHGNWSPLLPVPIRPNNWNRISTMPLGPAMACQGSRNRTPRDGWSEVLNIAKPIAPRFRCPASAYGAGAHEFVTIAWATWDCVSSCLPNGSLF